MAHRDNDKLESRIDRFLHERLAPAITATSAPLQAAAWTAPGEPVDFATATGSGNTFAPVLPGTAWGPAWATTWFRVCGHAPARRPPAEAGRYRFELSLDLGFNGAKPGFQCEGLVRDEHGHVIKGLEPRNHQVPLQCEPGSAFTVWVEGAANPDLTGGNDFGSPNAFAPTPFGDPLTVPAVPLYRLGDFLAVEVDTEVESLFLEATVLFGLLRELPPGTPRRQLLLGGLQDAINAMDPGNVAAGAVEARKILAPLLAAPAEHSAHRIFATGHAHIDSAWLWPTRETVRKCARTFSNVLDLMDRDPELTFTCSSAQQFAWMKQYHPGIFARIAERVAEGRFVPVGNMWVESDVNMPSGESLVRQFQQGARFFDTEFGAISDVGWLPDSFGYSAALPQLLRKSGLRWFFTQKMCWNETNSMPHHSFLWEGLDGSRIFTHFPPTNTYSGDMRPTELARSVRNFKDHGDASMSLMPFGYGDGGGGPTREMMQLGRLQENLEGSPRVRFSSAHDFFAEAEQDYRNPPIWSGEMYLEFHRGIYTSQARTKSGNRRNERLLVEAEYWAAVACIRHGLAFPYERFDRLWQQVLLLQFHDILPGSAIAWVHREAEATHAAVSEELDQVITQSLAAIAGEGREEFVFNASPATADGVPSRSGAPAAVRKQQLLARGPEGNFILRNGLVELTVTPEGHISSLIDLGTGRDVIPRGRLANMLQLHRDTPNQWDAWDIDLSYRDTVVEVFDGSAEPGSDGKEILVRREFGNSTVQQRIGLSGTEPAVRIQTSVDWHEKQKLLKLAFPLDVHAGFSSSETQFGHVQRPVHNNTSWEHAKYEFCAHRWLHVGEPDFGVAVASDAVYGYDVERDIHDGRVSTTVRQSLLRAPTFPDPEADQGHHDFLTTITVAPGIGDAIRAGYAANTHRRPVRGSRGASALVSVDNPAIVAETVTLASDRSGDLVVRLYESQGRRAKAALAVSADIAGVTEVDLLDRPASGGGVVLSAEGSVIRVELRPFEVASLRFKLTSTEESQ
ncbi:glycoside hydrolase family 38 C-terminal domain-containing protein [Pseudarthrobacter sp. fls2-241-R2A-127]|uniref:alpha-mannosidase n=1 Tax=Pseudarthrobacter sp. fls2-241-R2A-127 TaxID=3040303 RepID=UPI002556FD9F|nr:glycoside hydrolase family 38 C-terminal domain-containing protein [Pseudarthrobacter sp. fls2-241-R2A-127]